MTNRYTYRITWSPEDRQHLGLCVEFPSMSWLASTLEQALAGIQEIVREVLADMRREGEQVPKPVADREDELAPGGPIRQGA